MPDPYGVTQHADADRITADAMFGTPAGSVTADAMYGSPATFSTAPYRGRDIHGRKLTRYGRCKGKNDTCEAYPVRGTDLCVFHSPGQARHDREEVDESPEPA